MPVELLGRTAFPPIGELPYLLTLAAHGFYWFRLASDVPVPHWHDERTAGGEPPGRDPSDGWKSLFAEQVPIWRCGAANKAREQFETDALPRFIESAALVRGKGEDGDAGRHRRRTPAGTRTGCCSWSRCLARPTDATYFVPLVSGLGRRATTSA